MIQKHALTAYCYMKSFVLLLNLLDIDLISICPYKRYALYVAYRMQATVYLTTCTLISGGDILEPPPQLPVGLLPVLPAAHRGAIPARHSHRHCRPGTQFERILTLFYQQGVPQAGGDFVYCTQLSIWNQHNPLTELVPRSVQGSNLFMFCCV